jgi:hypothetical protein
LDALKLQHPRLLQHQGLPQKGKNISAQIQCTRYSLFGLTRAWRFPMIAAPYGRLEPCEILTFLIFQPPCWIRIRLILIALFKEGKWAQI